LPPSARLIARCTASNGSTPPASLNGCTPYDTDARFGKKRDITWIGYKAHLSETCDSGEPYVIVNVLTKPAPMTDMEVTALVHQALAGRNLLLATHFVDAAYVDAGLLTAGRAEHGIKLVGPMLPDTSWLAKAAEGYVLPAFRIDWEAHTVTCPQGQVATYWTATLDKWSSESDMPAGPGSREPYPKQSATSGFGGAATLDYARPGSSTFSPHWPSTLPGSTLGSPSNQSPKPELAPSPPFCRQSPNAPANSPTVSLYGVTP
jgi:hypothetical protein